ASSSAMKIVAKLTNPDTDIVFAACSSLSALDCESEAVGRLLSHAEPRIRAASLNALKGMRNIEGFAATA
ncbi:unnamed protein product, partial [Polarella glacialis]